MTASRRGKITPTDLLEAYRDNATGRGSVAAPRKVAFDTETSVCVL